MTRIERLPRESQKTYQTRVCQLLKLGDPVDWLDVLPDSAATEIPALPMVQIPLKQEEKLKKRIHRYGRKFTPCFVNWYPWTIPDGYTRYTLGYTHEEVKA